MLFQAKIVTGWSSLDGDRSLLRAQLADRVHRCPSRRGVATRLGGCRPVDAEADERARRVRVSQATVAEMSALPDVERHGQPRPSG
jgi:hypothetical protein